MKYNKLLFTIAIMLMGLGAVAQDKSADSTAVKDDRNVMLNAASANAGPRNVMWVYLQV